LRVEPAREQRKMLSQRFTILPGGILGLLLFPGMTLYRRVCGQMLAQNLFDRARLASEFSEAQKERLGNQAAAHGEDCNRILLCCNPQSKAPDTFSSPNTCSRESLGRAGS